MKKIFNLLFEFSSCAALRRGAELLRDCVKSVRDNAAVYFTSLTLAARKERESAEAWERESLLREVQSSRACELESL